MCIFLVIPEQNFQVNIRLYISRTKYAIFASATNVSYSLKSLEANKFQLAKTPHVRINDIDERADLPFF